MQRLIRAGDRMDADEVQLRAAVLGGHKTVNLPN